MNVRFVAATNRDIVDAIRKGDFREDLFHRLNVVQFRVPPLRERGEDVLLLAEHFLQLFAAQMNRSVRKLSAAARDKLLDHHWPGNVRELRNAAERYAIGMPVSLLPGDELPPSTKLSLAQQVDAFEKKVIERSLAEAGGRISVVMERLDIPRRTLSEKIAKFGLDRRKYRDPSRQNPADDASATGG